MKISYISDLHLDFHCQFTVNQIKWEARTREYISNLINTTDTSDRGVIVLGGDHSHYNIQTKWMLETFASHYKRVFIVFGNHDYYLVSMNQVDKYKGKSHNRIKEIEKWVSTEKSLSNVTTLNSGKVEEYNGVRFGGDTMWYPLETYQQETFFYENSNDSRLILGLNNKIEHSLSVMNYNTMISKGIDVMISHVPVIPIESHQLYGQDSCYYTPVEELPAYVIQGHSHERAEYEKAGTKIYMNCLGYPQDRLGEAEIKSFKITI